jgi:hypothetical protein
VNAHGLVLSWIDAEAMRPFARGFFTPDMDILRHPGAATEAEFGAYMAYENTGMCTGAYLAALVWKYRVTAEASALDQARRTFRALAKLYDLSQAVEPGFFSKFHCGRLSREMSTDQCLYAMVGLDQFAPLATDAERAKIREIIGGIAGMWLRRQYRHPYRERTHDWQWPLNRFPVFNWLAWKHTGEQRFRAEFERLAALPEVKAGPPFVPMFGVPPLGGIRTGVRRRSPDRAGASTAGLPRRTGDLRSDVVRGQETGAQPEMEPFLWPAVPEHTASAAASLIPLLEHDAPQRDTWLRQLRVAYETGRRAIGDDCLERGHFYYDPATGAIQPVEKPFYAGGQPNPVWRHKGFVADVKSGHSPTMFARAAFQIHRYHADLGAADTGRDILEAMDLPQMRWKIDYRDQLPPDQKWMTRAFDGDALVHWLWAYWLARAEGLI